MTVEELMIELREIVDTKRQVVISNVRNAPFATYTIKEVVNSEEGPVYIRAKRSDSE